jgi:predicted RNase H-like HicB family nuclease
MVPPYIAYLRKDKDSDYGVEFPDMPGCVSAGKTPDEAEAMAAEALRGHVWMLKEMGEPVPAPSGLDQMAEYPHRENVVMVMIDLDPTLLRAQEE